MLQKAEAIYHKANELVRRCGTRDTLRIASEIGIYIHQIDDFKELLGMYSYQHKERHILLNSNMDYITAQMLVLTSIRSRKSRRVCEMSTYDSTDALARHILADKEGRCRRQHYGYR